MNQQLLDYIKQQLQLGVSKDAVKNTLVSSGWPEADVQAAFAALAAPATPAASPAAAPAAVSDIHQPKSEPAAAQPAVAVKKAETVFQSKPAAMMGASAAASPVSAAMPASAGAARSWKSLLLPAVLGVLLLASVGGAAYFYMETSALSEELTTSSQSNQDLARQNNVASQEKSSLEAQLVSLREENSDLALHVALLALPTGTSTAPAALTIQGTLRGDEKTGFSVVTSRGVSVKIRNWNDSRVKGMLAPLLNNGLRVSGNYNAFTKEIILTAVNDVQVPVEQAPAPSSTPASADKPIVP